MRKVVLGIKERRIDTSSNSNILFDLYANGWGKGSKSTNVLVIKFGMSCLTFHLRYGVWRSETIRNMISYKKFRDIMSMIQVCDPKDMNTTDPYMKSVSKLTDIFNETANKYHGSNSSNIFLG